MLAVVRQGLPRPAAGLEAHQVLAEPRGRDPGRGELDHRGPLERRQTTHVVVVRRDERPVRAAAAARHEMATMRSIGMRARSAMSSGTRTSCSMFFSASRSFGSVIIFM